MRFSQRYGYKPVKEIIQKESMDAELLNKLWNVINLYILRQSQLLIKFSNCKGGLPN